MGKYTLKELPEQYRPRERLMGIGAQNLSDQELIGIILRTGNSNETAVQLGERVLHRFGSLQALSKLYPSELTSIQGIGIAKATQISAAFELGRRAQGEPPLCRSKIKEPHDVARLLSQEMKSLDREHFRAVLLNTKNYVIATAKISIGTLNASLVHPRELFKEAIKHSSNAIILVHNHPSGEKSPSKEDIELTKRIKDAGDLIGINVIDHVIIAANTFFSFKENQLI